jgi:hypothetical protein
MKRKVIPVRIKHPKHYLRLFNGIYNLTASERDVLAEFLLVHITLTRLDSKVNAFSAIMKKKVAKRMGKKDFNSLNTYIKAIADKGAITKIDGGYRIHPHLVPGGEDEIVFKIK